MPINPGFMQEAAGLPELQKAAGIISMSAA